MNLCSGNYPESHEEICYEGKTCPLCEALKENKDIQDKLDSANDSLRQYE